MGKGGTTQTYVEGATMKVLRPYAIAAISVTLALLLTLLMTPPHQPIRFLLFVLAVVLSANEGIWPGVFATLLSAGLAAYFLIQPMDWSAVSDSGELVRMLQFCGLSLGITWVTHRFQHSDEEIRAAAAVVESLAESIIQQGLDNTIQSWNKAAERIYGYTAEEAIGRPVSVIVPPDRREELQQLVERVHLGAAIQGHETVRIRKDGTPIDVALTLSPVQDRKGKIVGVSSIAREITERKQAEEAIRQSHAKLERQTRTIEDSGGDERNSPGEFDPRGCLCGHRPLRANTHSRKLRRAVCAFRLQRQLGDGPPMGRTETE